MEDGNIHVWPEGENHDFNEGCWCSPERDLVAKKLLIHRMKQ